MFFVELREAFLNSLRTRVRNGELTERSLAKLVGISQPHMHNVLKGVRTLSPEMLDRFLYHLRLSALDSVDPAVMSRYLRTADRDASRYSYLPVVEGVLGPGYPWPERTVAHERFPVPGAVVSRMWCPVVARTGADTRMSPLFDEGDLVLLDQSHKARTELEIDGLYAVKLARAGLLRRIRTVGRVHYLATEDCLDNPAAWEKLPVSGHQLPHFIRARATLMTREVEWE